MLNPLTEHLTLFLPVFKSRTSQAWWACAGIYPAHCIAAYQAKGAASYEATKINLANPGVHTLVNDGVDVAWSAEDGWGPFGTTCRVFKINLMVGNNWSVLCRFSGVTISSSSYMLYGTYGVTDNRMHCAPNRDRATGRYSSGALVDRAPIVTAGVCGTVGRYAWVNSVKTGSAITEFTGSPHSLFGVGGASTSDANISYACYCYLQAFSLWDTVLTDEQAAAVCIAMAAL
jgi:hypothetical protein